MKTLTPLYYTKDWALSSYSQSEDPRYGSGLPCTHKNVYGNSKL